MLASDLRNFRNKHDDHQGDSMIQLIEHSHNGLGNATCHNQTCPPNLHSLPNYFKLQLSHVKFQNLKIMPGKANDIHGINSTLKLHNHLVHSGFKLSCAVMLARKSACQFPCDKMGLSWGLRPRREFVNCFNVFQF